MTGRNYIAFDVLDAAASAAEVQLPRPLENSNQGVVTARTLSRRSRACAAKRRTLLIITHRRRFTRRGMRTSIYEQSFDITRCLV